MPTVTTRERIVSVSRTVTTGGATGSADATALATHAALKAAGTSVDLALVREVLASAAAEEAATRGRAAGDTVAGAGTATPIPLQGNAGFSPLGLQLAAQSVDVKGDPSVGRAAQALAGKSMWGETRVEAVMRDRYERKDYGDGFSTWVKRSDAVTSVPKVMNCHDLLVIAAVHSGAITAAQAQIIDDTGLQVAAKGANRATSRVAGIPTYAPDVATDARAAFLWDVMGFSRSTPLDPGASLHAGDVVFFGRTGDHVAIATGNGREVASIWNTGRFGEGAPVELTTVDKLVQHFEDTVEDPKNVPKNLAHRFTTDHLAPRWAQGTSSTGKPTPAVRVAPSPFRDLAQASFSTSDAAWAATTRILGEETPATLESLRARLHG